MKIGFLGNLAGNAWQMAKNFRAAGLDTEYINDLDHYHLFCFPDWYEQYLKIGMDKVEETRQAWLAKLASPGGKPRGKTWSLAALKSYKDVPAEKTAISLDQIRSCDKLVVSGINGMLLAAAAGKEHDCIFWPAGGDWRLITEGEGRPSGIKARLPFEFTRLILKSSLGKYPVFSSHDPVQDYSRRWHKKLRYLPFPLPVHQPLKSKEKVWELIGLDERETAGKTVIFMPSRISFIWKKTNVFLEAFLEASSRNRNLLLIVPAWGQDRDRVCEMTDGASIKLLDSVFSIPFLYDIYSHCDLVADQFSLGSYGTAAVGAFSCGRPVLTYIDEDRFREKGFPVPPVINCRTKEEIVSALEKVAAHPDLLKEKAGQMREWFLITHQYQAAAKKLNELLAEF